MEVARQGRQLDDATLDLEDERKTKRDLRKDLQIGKETALQAFSELESLKVGGPKAEDLMRRFF